MSEVKKYRKKPVVIEAWLFSHDPNENGWIDELMDDYSHIDYDVDENQIEIHTLEGTMTGRLGDFIIKGVQGEFYPCKPDIFAATYEAVVPGE